MPRRQYTPNRMRTTLVDKHWRKHLQQQQTVAAETRKSKAAVATADVTPLPPPHVTVTSHETEPEVNLGPENMALWE